MRSLLLVLGVAACTDGPDTLGDDPTSRQIPPRGSVDIATWLAAGYYKDWHCEPEVHLARPGSPHGANRICNNELLHDARDDEGTWPLGAASVKEVVRESSIVVYAVYRKVEDAPGGDSWYWYEGLDDHVAANGQGDAGCTGCHSAAERDFVFTVVP